MGSKKVVAIFDNGGGLALQLGDAYAHYYDDMRQAAADYREYKSTGTTDGWEGHEPEHMEVSWTSDDIQNGGVRLMDAESIEQAVGNPFFSTGWKNIQEFVEALQTK